MSFELDPAAAGAIGASAKWLWDTYGKPLLDRLGREGHERWTKSQWDESAESYLTSLHDQVSWLRVLGKPEGQPIERLYTAVNVLDKLAAQRWYDIEALEKEYEPRRGLRWQREERRDGLALAREADRLFILGKPGAGKTTFLKHVALQAIKGEFGEKIPIFVTLKEMSDAELGIVPFIVEQFRVHDFPEAEPFVRDLLKDGRAIVLFDGLDEVNLEGNRRADLIEALKQFVREFGESQIFITCRLAASDYTFARFT